MSSQLDNRDSGRIPEDAPAERAVVGCCVDSHHGYTLAAGRLEPDDFYDPPVRRLYEACAHLADLDGPALDLLDARILRAASRARLTTTVVRALVEDRPVQWDRNGTYAHRVARASRARRVMAACADTFNELAHGQPLDRVLAGPAGQLERLLEDAR